MTPDHNQRVDDLFGQALQLDENERAEFLKSECGHDTELLREVEQLLGLKAENDRLELEVALLKEEIRIKDARLRCLA